MIDVGLILAPNMKSDEPESLYVAKFIPFKYYPPAFKMCLMISSCVCLIMFFWIECIFIFVK